MVRLPPAPARPRRSRQRRPAAAQRHQHRRRRRPVLVRRQPRGRQHAEAKLAQHRRQHVRLDRQARRQPGRQRRRARAGRDSPVRRRFSRRYPAAAGSARPPPSPAMAANPGGQSGWSAGTDTSAGVRQRAASATPWCNSAHSRTRIAAARGFISAGMNSANRPERTPIARSRGRRSGARVSSSTPGIRPSASVSRCTGPRSAGFGLRQRLGGEQRREIGADLPIHPGLQPGAHPLPLRAVQKFAVQHLHARAQRHAAADQPGDRDAVPGHAVIGGQGEVAVGRAFQHADPARHLGPQRAAGGAQHQLLLVANRQRDRGRSRSPRYGRPCGPPRRPRRGG